MVELESFRHYRFAHAHNLAPRRALNNRPADDQHMYMYKDGGITKTQKFTEKNKMLFVRISNCVVERDERKNRVNLIRFKKQNKKSTFCHRVN